VLGCAHGCALTVSCSEGVGCTGTFLCIHSQLEQLKAEGVANILQAIKSAHMQRPGRVSDAVSSNATLCSCYSIIDVLLSSTGPVCLLPPGSGQSCGHI